MLSLESVLCLREPQRCKKPPQKLPCPAGNHLELKSLASLKSKVLWASGNLLSSCPYTK